MITTAAALALAACDGTDLGERAQGLDAYCQATVNTAGGAVTVDVETDYLPRVVNCENGAADQAALEAQAVAARSYLYYRLDDTGDIGDGQGDQVYTCGRTPGPEHVAAAASTAGVVLRYPPATAAVQVAAFYVAGARDQVGPGCRGSTDDPTNTERYVTYNEGQSGADVTQTTLGFVSPTNFANRGCMSQNGADCLAEEGRSFDDILRFYYGADIVIEHAIGDCAPEVDAGTGGSDGGDPADGETTGGCGCASGGGDHAATGLIVLAAFAYTGRRCRRRRC